jgi:hypothetical protein
VKRFLYGFFLAVGTLSILWGALGIVARNSGGPLGPIPGGVLRGEFTREAAPDLSRVAAQREVQLQVAPETPRSMNVWVVVVDERIFVPAALAPWKLWPALLEHDDRAVLRVDGRLYERRAKRVEEAALRERLASEVARKYGLSSGGSERTWFFELRAASDASR